MAREGRGLFVTIFKDIIKSLTPRTFKATLVGKDTNDNKYYEIRSERGRDSRYFVPKGGDESNFESELLPAEWQSWLRHRRKHPPTDEEIASNLLMMKERKEKALKIEEKFKPQVQTKPVLDKGYPKYEEFGKKPWQ